MLHLLVFADFILFYAFDAYEKKACHKNQELVVSGAVTSKASDEFLPGVNVLVKGTNFGTTTDVNGNFRLSLANMSRATLVISFIGYKSAEVEVTASAQALNAYVLGVQENT